MVTPIPESIYEDYGYLVHRIAYIYAKKFNGVDVNDIRQELWLWFASHPNNINNWLETKEPKEITSLFARSLHNAARDYCLKEKAIIEGYNYNDYFWYSKEFIKVLLPSVLSDDWKKVERFSSEIKAQKSPSESGDWMAYSADIKKAYERLNDKEQALVLMFYGNDADGETLHKELGGDRPTARATQMAANRAINKMVLTLGGTRPFKDYDEEPKEEVEDEDSTQDIDVQD